MLSQEQLSSPVEGILAGDAYVLLHLIARMVSNSQIADSELATVGLLRMRLVEGLEKSTGVNFDKARAAAMQAQQGRAEAAKKGETE